LGTGERVPDRLGQLTGDLDAGNLGTMLTSEALLDSLVVGGEDGMVGGMNGGLDQRPAQVLGSVIGLS
jgi:hypothetical protein